MARKPHQSLKAAALLFAATLPAGPLLAQSVEQLRQLSIEELADIRVSSVSKSSEPLRDAAAAVYVITHDDIMRSGAHTIPEMLRLAPNLEVAQLTPTSYAVSARGFNVGDNASLSNKLLIMIDGRSVYSPMFGGVYWDMQNVPPDMVERIEVIRGPGATLWGANAVNGVINIITRKSADLQGGSVGLGGGNTGWGANFRYGGRIADDLTYAVHADGSRFYAYKDTNGRDAHDGWSNPEGGFRVDWTPAGDAVSVEGNVANLMETPDDFITGRNVSASWQHRMSGDASFQLLAYYDQMRRYAGNGQGGFSVDTYDVEGQQNLGLGSWGSLVWGVGERAFSYAFENTALQLVPDRNTLNIADVFAQDTLSLSDSVKLTLGVKLENEPYTGLETMPDMRLSWKPDESLLLWTAISRAARTPTPVDEDLREFAGPVDVIAGSHSFRPEVVTAYEAGTRLEAWPGANLALATFYNDYDDLRTLEFAPPGSPGLLTWGNRMKGDVYGAELWGDLHVTPWWRLRAGLDWQHEDLRFAPGSGLGGLALVADDPTYQASLRSSMALGNDVSFDAALRHVGPLPHPSVPAYTELDLRLGWAVTASWDLSLAGTNLLHPYHLEFIETGQSDRIPRSLWLDSRWRF
jgi:iron complex outermembrane receptor protein